MGGCYKNLWVSGSFGQQGVIAVAPYWPVVTAQQRAKQLVKNTSKRRLDNAHADCTSAYIHNGGL
jgi:hypothetical protein